MMADKALRCENSKCRFHTEPLIWNGKPLPTRQGRDGRTLCPACYSLELKR